MSNKRADEIWLRKCEKGNRLYRCPPSPRKEKLLEREKSFVLDCVPVGQISRDYTMSNPKYGSALPPYNAQRDPKCRHYFSFHGINNTLKKTNQNYPGTAIEGTILERFNTFSHAARYLNLRNKNGSGHSDCQIKGHSKLMENIKPFNSYNGSFGFRRNTPWLRKKPSSFNFQTTSPIH